MSYWVYMHINRINGKKYVGTTHRSNPKYRWEKGNGYKRNKHFSGAIKKYGWNSFDHCYMECRSEEEMYRLEQYYIDKYQTNNPDFGYNKSVGGEKSGWKGKNSHSPEYKKMCNKNTWDRHKEKYRVNHDKYMIEWRKQNKERMKEWRKQNKEYLKEQHKEYYIHNWEKRREYNQQNKERQAAYMKEYHLKKKLEKLNQEYNP